MTKGTVGNGQQVLEEFAAAADDDTMEVEDRAERGTLSSSSESPPPGRGDGGAATAQTTTTTTTTGSSGSEEDRAPTGSATGDAEAPGPSATTTTTPLRSAARDGPDAAGGADRGPPLLPDFKDQVRDARKLAQQQENKAARPLAAPPATTDDVLPDFKDQVRDRKRQHDNNKKPAKPITDPAPQNAEAQAAAAGHLPSFKDQARERRPPAPPGANDDDGGATAAAGRSGDGDDRRQRPQPQAGRATTCNAATPIGPGRWFEFFLGRTAAQHPAGGSAGRGFVHGRGSGGRSLCEPPSCDGSCRGCTC